MSKNLNYKLKPKDELRNSLTFPFPEMAPTCCSSDFRLGYVSHSVKERNFDYGKKNISVLICDTSNGSLLTDPCQFNL